MIRYLTIFLRMLKLSWIQAMEYRADFITWVIIDAFWGGLDGVFAVVLVSFTNTIGTWTLGQFLIVTGIYRFLVIPVWGWMFQSFARLPKLVSEGRLDLFLTKPADSQFMVSTSHFSFNIVSSLLSGSIMFISGLYISHSSINLIQCLLLVWLLIVATFLIYSLYFLTMTAVLFTDRIDNIYHIFPALYDISRYPSEIYTLLLQRIFTSIVPIAVLVAIPAQVVFGSLTWANFLWFHCLSIIFFIVGRLIWQSGLRRYSSASS